MSQRTSPDPPRPAVVSLVVAVAENGVIGRQGGLPWRLPDEIRHFKRLTTGHTVIMGRRTFDEIRAPLANRRNIVVTRNPAFAPPGVEVAASLVEALRLAAGEPEVFVVGGAEIYRLAIPLAQRLYLTRIHAAVEGDTHFPAWNPAEWRLHSEEHHPADARHRYAFTIRRYERVERAAA